MADLAAASSATAAAPVIPTSRLIRRRSRHDDDSRIRAAGTSIRGGARGGTRRWSTDMTMSLSSFSSASLSSASSSSSTTTPGVAHVHARHRHGHAHSASASASASANVDVDVDTARRSRAKQMGVSDETLRDRGGRPREKRTERHADRDRPAGDRGKGTSEGGGGGGVVVVLTGRKEDAARSSSSSSSLSFSFSLPAIRERLSVGGEAADVFGDTEQEVGARASSSPLGEHFPWDDDDDDNDNDDDDHHNGVDDWRKRDHEAVDGDGEYEALAARDEEGRQGDPNGHDDEDCEPDEGNLFTFQWAASAPSSAPAPSVSSSSLHRNLEKDEEAEGRREQASDDRSAVRETAKKDERTSRKNVNVGIEDDCRKEKTNKEDDRKGTNDWGNGGVNEKNDNDNDNDNDDDYDYDSQSVDASRQGRHRTRSDQPTVSARRFSAFSVSSARFGGSDNREKRRATARHRARAASFSGGTGAAAELEVLSIFAAARRKSAGLANSDSHLNVIDFDGSWKEDIETHEKEIMLEESEKDDSYDDDDDDDDDEEETENGIDGEKNDSVVPVGIKGWNRMSKLDVKYDDGALRRRRGIELLSAFAAELQRESGVGGCDEATRRSNRNCDHVPTFLNAEAASDSKGEDEDGSVGGVGVDDFFNGTFSDFAVEGFDKECGDAFEAFGRVFEEGGCDTATFSLFEIAAMDDFAQFGEEDRSMGNNASAPSLGGGACAKPIKRTKSREFLFVLPEDETEECGEGGKVRRALALQIEEEEDDEGEGVYGVAEIADRRKSTIRRPSMSVLRLPSDLARQLEEQEMENEEQEMENEEQEMENEEQELQHFRQPLDLEEARKKARSSRMSRGIRRRTSFSVLELPPGTVKEMEGNEKAKTGALNDGEDLLGSVTWKQDSFSQHSQASFSTSSYNESAANSLGVERMESFSFLQFNPQAVAHGDRSGNAGVAHQRIRPIVTRVGDNSSGMLLSIPDEHAAALGRLCNPPLAGSLDVIKEPEQTFREGKTFSGLHLRARFLRLKRPFEELGGMLRAGGANMYHKGIGGNGCDDAGEDTLPQSSFSQKNSEPAYLWQKKTGGQTASDSTKTVAEQSSMLSSVRSSPVKNDESRISQIEPRDLPSADDQESLLRTPFITSPQDEENVGKNEIVDTAKPSRRNRSFKAISGSSSLRRLSLTGVAGNSATVASSGQFHPLINKCDEENDDEFVAPSFISANNRGRQEESRGRRVRSRSGSVGQSRLARSLSRGRTRGSDEHVRSDGPKILKKSRSRSLGREISSKAEWDSDNRNQQNERCRSRLNGSGAGNRDVTRKYKEWNQADQMERFRDAGHRSTLREGQEHRALRARSRTGTSRPKSRPRERRERQGSRARSHAETAGTGSNSQGHEKRVNRANLRTQGAVAGNTLKMHPGHHYRQEQRMARREALGTQDDHLQERKFNSIQRSDIHRDNPRDQSHFHNVRRKGPRKNTSDENDNYHSPATHERRPRQKSTNVSSQERYVIPNSKVPDSVDPLPKALSPQGLSQSFPPNMTFKNSAAAGSVETATTTSTSAASDCSRRQSAIMQRAGRRNDKHVSHFIRRARDAAEGRRDSRERRGATKDHGRRGNSVGPTGIAELRSRRQSPSEGNCEAQFQIRRSSSTPTLTEPVPTSMDAVEWGQSKSVRSTTWAQLQKATKGDSESEAKDNFFGGDDWVFDHQ